MGTDAESTKQGKLLKIRGNAWYALFAHIRTFLATPEGKAKLKELMSSLTE